MKREEKFWRGFVSGLSRGQIVIGFNEDELSALFFDQRFGRCVVEAIGSRKGDLAQFRITSFYGSAPFTALDGVVSIRFFDSFASGELISEMRGGELVFVLWPTPISEAGWRLRKAFYRSCVFWSRSIPALYLLGCIALAVDTIYRKFEISIPQAILLLLTAPFVLRRKVPELILLMRELGISKVGPLEIGQVTPSAIAEAAKKPGQARFVTLDKLFVPLTKHLLVWLSINGPTSVEQFKSRAASFGASQENQQAILDVLLETRCVSVKDDAISVEQPGAEYIQHLLDKGPK